MKISLIMMILTDMMFVLDRVLAMYYKLKKKDTGEAVWYLGFAIMMLITHSMWRI